MIALFLLTAVLFPIVGYLYISWKYSYWNRKGIYQLEPKFPYGNFSEQANGTMGIADNFTKIYREIKSNGHKHGGIYQLIKPIYVPTDLDIIRHILQKDFNHFVNHGGFVNEKNDPLSAHLFGLEDEKWRNLRAKLTPTFTTGKMKMMFPTMVACTEGLRKVLKESAKLQDAVDIKDVVARFTTDIIGSAGFGLDVNSLNNPDSVFRKFGKKLFNDGFWGRIKRMLAQSMPKSLLSLIKFKLTDPEVEEFFMGVVENIIEYREKNNIYRKDFMHLMLQLKNKGKITDDEDIKESFDGDGHLSVTQVAAQCFVFFVGGFETSSTTMTLALLELAQNKDVQNKLREEIKTVLKKHDNQITYEAIMEMPYLDKVVYETLRKHSPAPGTPRVCNKTYKVPNTDLVLDVGTRVIIPVFGIHRDPEYYPEPEKFDPERFNEENKAKRHPCAFLPFGEGPRMCIGARFGMLQTKVGLAAIIRDFDVTLSSKTKLPITYSIKSPITSIYGDVWLNLKTIE